MDWCVYMLECSDGSLYTGIARNLKNRITAHNEGKGARYTRSRRPVRLVWSEPAFDRSTASQREAQIKSMGRQAKLALIP